MTLEQALAILMFNPRYDGTNSKPYLDKLLQELFMKQFEDEETAHEMAEAFMVVLKDVLINKRAPVGYLLEFQPGDYCYYSPEDYEKERQAGYNGAKIWGLFSEPQPGCPSDVEVYRGWCWVQPRYASADRDMTGFTPLFRGSLIQLAP